MKAITLADIKQELQHLDKKQIAELCLRLARYKKENKELLAYLLFDADDTDNYIQQVKAMMDDDFSELNISQLYLAKKSLRKILRIVNKHIKFAQQKQTEAELRLHFCMLLKKSGIAYTSNKALHNLYLQQIKKIETAISALHDDIQYDLHKQLEQL
jgi:hypothetical protein